MKIIDRENTKVYVQLHDIMTLANAGIPTPSYMLIKTFGEGVVLLNNKKRYNFIEFDGISDIEFFEACNWILDYMKIKDLSDEELEVEKEKVIQEYNENTLMYNLMTKKSRAVYTHITVLKSKIEDFSQIQLIREQREEIPFNISSEAKVKFLNRDTKLRLD